MREDAQEDDEDFQLTTSQGGRRQPFRHFRHVFRLSTHDLTRRSTDSSTHSGLAIWSFNSRPHKEVDENLKKIKKGSDLSTHDLTRRSTSYVF